MDPSSSNAQAGPSSIPLFLVPQHPSAPPPLLASTQDLLTRFNLLSAYEKYVRPYATPVFGVEASPGTSTTVDKGKGRDREVSPGDLEDEDARGEKKKKNSYKHLIKGIPGKHSMKKDDYLATAMQVPPKQRIPITPFDMRTQREAFSVSLDGLKSWNIHALVLESAQAREDRKKRKELKKLAKAQALASGVQGIPSKTTTIARSVTPLNNSGIMRGQKREHEEGNGSEPSPVMGMNHAAISGIESVSPVIGARPGSGGVRPRPIKKQRMDMQGQARDMPIQQQPTPQGV